jgi:uncharacterized protein (DUF2236 family)
VAGVPRAAAHHDRNASGIDPAQLITIGTLPASIRQAYGFEWRPRDARALARWTALLRTSRRLLPPPAREWRMARRRDLSPPSRESHRVLTVDDNVGTAKIRS